MLTPVILSGFLAKRFGKRFDLAVRCPREAVRALCVQLDGFERALLDYQPGFRVWLDREEVADGTLLDGPHAAAPIRIVPVVAGGKSGAASILIGAALIYFSGGIASGFTMEGSVAEAQLAAGIAGIGTSMVMGGIAQILIGAPKQPQAPVVNQPNFVYNGAVNTTQSGNPVPWGFGRMIIGSQVISGAIISEQTVANATLTNPVWNDY